MIRLSREGSAEGAQSLSRAGRRDGDGHGHSPNRRRWTRRDAMGLCARTRRRRDPRVPCWLTTSFATYFTSSRTPSKSRATSSSSITRTPLVDPHHGVVTPSASRKPMTSNGPVHSQLENDGITKRTLRAGDFVRIWASPNRDPSDNRIRLKRIERRARQLAVGAEPPREPLRANHKGHKEHKVTVRLSVVNTPC